MEKIQTNEVGTESSSLWDFFPLSMCINLRERADRFEEAKNEFRRVGMRQVVFYQPERQPDRDKAIIDSHMACLRYAIEQEVPYVLVFEDDAMFLENYETNLGHVVNFLRSRSDWNLFHLGGFIFRKVEYITPHILRGALLNVHAVVVRTEFAKKILEMRPYCSGMSVDLFYSALNGDRSFVHINPLICIQRPSASDGSWDKKSKNKEGWLGNAMIYTSLDFKGRLGFNHFSYLERFRIENGISFFKVYRPICRRRIEKAQENVRKGTAAPVETNTEGSYAVVDLREIPVIGGQ
ncbi:MAG TPA: glycosyltransferase family 25 protein [Chthoniobacterales bacterium]